MTDGALLFRAVLSAVIVVVTFAVEHRIFRRTVRRTQWLREQMSAYRAQLDEALRAAASKEPNARERKSEKSVPMCRAFRTLTPEEQKARKDWARARLMKHPKIPSWKRDADYLSLILDSARGGCTEALNKLEEYAFRRGAYVEAYYWALKLELSDARITAQQPSVILRQWIRHGASAADHHFHRGFDIDQYRFARAVLRLRSGVDKEKGLQRLCRLVEERDPDALLFARKNGMEGATGRTTEGST